MTRRAHFRITDRGREVLRENPHKIDVRLLERFPEFTEFKSRARQSQRGVPSTVPIEVASDDSSRASQTRRPRRAAPRPRRLAEHENDSLLPSALMNATGGQSLRPGDLPVEQRIKVDLFLNLKVAKALDL